VTYPNQECNATKGKDLSGNIIPHYQKREEALKNSLTLYEEMVKYVAKNDDL